MTAERQERTLIFCTAFAPSGPQKMARGDSDSYYSWNVRYRIWLEAIKRSGLRFDQILIVDDGSQQLPTWDDLHIIHEGDALQTGAPIVLYHFLQRLGRRSVSEFPGWVRSFFFVAQYAEVNGFTRIVHIESDAFLITKKACDALNTAPDGWTAVWSTRYARPESSIQVISGDGLRAYRQMASRPVASFDGAVIETTLPFSRIEQNLVGGRYGQDLLNWVPGGADWCMQARPTSLGSYTRYFWWLPWFAEVFPHLDACALGASVVDVTSSALSHNGMHYLEWLREFSARAAPRKYFEIGTHTGSSLRMVAADAVCVDPAFKITSDAIGERRNTHFFQGTSDEFFSDRHLVKSLFPWGVDLAFLDGLHLFEALLRDFTNTEALTEPDSVIVIHDCLPFNLRMAERARRLGAEDEPAEIRDFWTGDVWKILPIFRKYRPDLSVLCLDCPPTGLVICGSLDRKSTVLRVNYDRIVEEFSAMTLSGDGLKDIWSLYPTFDSHEAFPRT